MTEQTLRPYSPTWRDKLGSYLYDMTSKSPEARNFVGGLVGSTGLGTTGMSVADATPLGMGLQFQESAQHGDPKGMAMAVLPMPAKAGAGMMRAPYQRKLSPQGLYSWGAEAAYNLPQENMTVQQARAMLEKAGTKPDEFHWSGFHQAFPDPNAKVSRDQLVSHFENNVPQLGETVLGGVRKLTPEQEAHVASGLQTLQEKSQFLPSHYRGPGSLDTLLLRDIAHWKNEGVITADQASALRERELIAQNTPNTKFGGYTLPGGDNYREVLTTLKPDRISDQEGAKRIWSTMNGNRRWEDLTPTERQVITNGYIDSGYIERNTTPDTGYTSQHWDEPNVLAHLRLSDRTDAGGNKLLHMEESQSDWGQAARKKGIKITDNGPIEAANEEFEQSGKFIGDLFRRLESEGLSEAQIFDHPEMLDAARKQDEIGRRIGEINLRMKSGVPNAPYIGSTGNKSATGWTDLNLKRALWEAAQNDADALAWTPGADQAARYDLSKQISRIQLHDNQSGGIGDPRLEGPFSGGMLHAWNNDGNKVISRHIGDEDELAAHIGKEAAERLLNAEPTASRSGGIGVRQRLLEGQDLSVGGEGMKAYYDRTIPTQLGAVMKRAGIEGGEMGTAHVFPHTIDMIDPESEPKALPSLRLTPAMREQIKRGLPYFGLAPVGLGMVPKNEEQR